MTCIKTRREGGRQEHAMMRLEEGKLSVCHFVVVSFT